VENKDEEMEVTSSAKSTSNGTLLTNRVTDCHEDNTAIGSNAGNGVYMGSSNNNTLIGYNSGISINSGGSNNTLIGANTGSTSRFVGINNIIIGYGATVSQNNTSNEITIGTSSANNTTYETGLFRMNASSASFSCNATTMSTTSAALTVVGGIGLGGAIYQW
jgi:hypothetical protein